MGSRSTTASGARPEADPPPPEGAVRGLPPAISAASLVETPLGPRPVGVLEPGDQLLTEQGPARIVWIARRTLSVGEMTLHPERRPLEIAPGALGTAMPLRRLTLSPETLIRPMAATGQGWRTPSNGFERLDRIAARLGLYQRPPAWSLELVSLVIDRPGAICLGGILALPLRTQARDLARLTPDERHDLAASLVHVLAERAEHRQATPNRRRG